MKGLRSGVVSESVREGRAWLDFARQVEDAGIDVLLLRDHFSAGAFGQQLASFTGLAAAAAVTTQLRLGTMVLSNDFRHPAVLAHEAASLHLVSGVSTPSSTWSTRRPGTGSGTWRLMRSARSSSPPSAAPRRRI